MSESGDPSRKSRYAVAAVGADRPGIVSAVTGVLVESGCNLADTAMTILGGCFAMMLVVESEVGSAGASLEAALAPVAADLGLIVMVRPIADDGSGPTTPRPAEGQRCTASVYGADHPGIVHGVAEFLAGQGVNIIDLTTRVVGAPANPVYAMVLELDLPGGVDPERLGAEMEVLAAGLGVSASLHPSEADIL